jgi:phosphonate transport system ATP-binding protein
MVQVADVSKSYGTIRALSQTSIAFKRGETVALVGPSGSGKTTLLHLLAGTLRPDTGHVFIDGRPITTITNRRERSRLVGVMYQQHDIVLSLSVVHNVLAGRLGDWSFFRSLLSLVSPRDVERAHDALERVGIAGKLYTRTSRLSGGEQQRVALARLLIQSPRVILADEPVSSVDPARARDLIQLLVGIARDADRTLIVSVHSPALACTYFDRIIAVRAGTVVFDRASSDVHENDLTSLYALTDSLSDTSAFITG